MGGTDANRNSFIYDSYVNLALTCVLECMSIFTRLSIDIDTIRYCAGMLREGCVLRLT